MAPLNRARLTITPAGAQWWGKATRWCRAPLPRGFEDIGDVRVGDRFGRLLHNVATGVYVLWDGACIASLDQRKVAAALAAREA